MSARRRRRSRGQWIPQLAHDVGLALAGFAYLAFVIVVVAMVGDWMGAM